MEAVLNDEPLRVFVKHNCWLVNRSGKHDAFTAVDQAMEQIVLAHKVSQQDILYQRLS